MSSSVKNLGGGGGSGEGITLEYITDLGQYVKTIGSNTKTYVPESVFDTSKYKEFYVKSQEGYTRAPALNWVSYPLRGGTSDTYELGAVAVMKSGDNYTVTHVAGLCNYNKGTQASVPCIIFESALSNCDLYGVPI